MHYTQSQLDQINAVLNRHADNLQGDQLSFYVHYWGAESNLQTNNLHKHSFFEVCYVVDGVGKYLEGSRIYPLHAGVLFLSRPHIRHQIFNEKGLYLIFIAFELIEHSSSKSAVQQFQKISRTKKFYCDQTTTNPAISLWQLLLQQAMHRHDFIDEALKNLSKSLIVSLYHHFVDSDTPPRKIQYISSTSTLMHRAKLFIRDNLSQELRLQDVAQYLHVSTRHLSRLFSIELGKTYSNYVRKERIRHAIELLTTSELSIKRIAEETGFDTVHYFTTIFKAETGETPGRFIKKERFQQTEGK